MNRFKLIFLLFVLAAGSVLFAQDKVFSASAPASVQVGQQFQYTINGNDQGDVSMPSMDKFDLLAGPFSSYSSQSQWINGKMTMNTVVSYTYIFRAREEGEYTIPPATIRAGRKTYETNDVHITITKGAPAAGNNANQPGGQSASATSETETSSTSDEESIYMRIIPSKTNLYIGEQFTAGLKIYTSVNTRPGENPGEVNYEGFYSKLIDPDQSSSRENINGKEYVTQVIQRHLLIPQKTGDLVIQPFDMKWLVQKQVKRKRTGSIFDDPFFDDPFFSSSYQDVPEVLSTKPVTIHVKSLPSGAPEGFTGAVGSFSMKADLTQSEVRVNEALSLIITVTGTGNLNLIGNPVVSLPPDHDVYDVAKKLNTDISGNRMSGSVVFEYPIVARHAGKFRISPINFSWFDPVTGTYKTSTSKEFVFEVKKGEGGEEEGAQVFIPGIQGSSVDNIGTDIRDIDRAIPVLHNSASFIFGELWYILFYPGILLAFILLIGLLNNRIKKNADIRMVKNRRAGKIARERLKVADRFRKTGDEEHFFEETGKAIWTYLADKLLIDLSQLSKAAVIEKLVSAGISTEKAEELMSIIDACEFARFAPASERENPDKVFGEVLGLIRSIEETL